MNQLTDAGSGDYQKRMRSRREEFGRGAGGGGKKRYVYICMFAPPQIEIFEEFGLEEEVKNVNLWTAF